MGVVGEVKIGVAERIEGRDRVRLKGNDESESLRPPELAANSQKKQKTFLPLFSNPFPPKNNNTRFGDVFPITAK